MGANAPRDYTQATTKRLPAEYIHHKRQTAEEGGCSANFAGYAQSVRQRGSWKTASHSCEAHENRRGTN